MRFSLSSTALKIIACVAMLAAANVPQTLNIFFTLSAGLLALATLTRLPHKKSLPLVTGTLLFAEYLHFDYGAYGVLTILASHLFIHRKTAGGIALVFLPILYALYLALAGTLPLQFLALFYWFYPVHLFALWIIWYYLPYVVWSIPLS